MSLGLIRFPIILRLSIQGIIESPQVQTSRLTVINHAMSDLIMEYLHRRWHEILLPLISNDTEFRRPSLSLLFLSRYIQNY